MLSQCYWDHTFDIAQDFSDAYLDKPGAYEAHEQAFEDTLDMLFMGKDMGRVCEGREKIATIWI